MSWPHEIEREGCRADGVRKDDVRGAARCCPPPLYRAVEPRLLRGPGVVAGTEAGGRTSEAVAAAAAAA